MFLLVAKFKNASVTSRVTRLFSSFAANSNFKYNLEYAAICEQGVISRRRRVVKIPINL